MNGDRYGRAMTTGELVRHDTRSGITTITRCSGGMPAASARRGMRCGRADSLIRRWTTATTASDAGSSISRAVKAPIPVDRLVTCPGSIQATSASVPAPTTASYKGRAAARHAGRHQVARPARRPTRP